MKTRIKNSLVCLNHEEGEEIIFSDFVGRCPECGSEHVWPLEKWLEEEKKSA